MMSFRCVHSNLVHAQPSKKSSALQSHEITTTLRVCSTATGNMTSLIWIPSALIFPSRGCCHCRTQQTISRRIRAWRRTNLCTKMWKLTLRKKQIAFVVTSIQAAMITANFATNAHRSLTSPYRRLVSSTSCRLCTAHWSLSAIFDEVIAHRTIIGTPKTSTFSAPKHKKVHFLSSDDLRDFAPVFDADECSLSKFGFRQANDG